MSYTDTDISTLKGELRVRERVAAMLGSSDIAGARHGVIEIYGNALDEASTGHGDRIDIKYYKDGSVSIRDYGRGVPIGWNDNEKHWNWHLIYNEMYGGGKFTTNQASLKMITDWNNFDSSNYNYLYSVGLNGLGAASTQYSSEYFTVRSYRDGKCYSRSFKEGRPLVNGEPVDFFDGSWSVEKLKAIPEEVTDTDEPNGTFIHWKPDIKVFSDINIGADWLLSQCDSISNIAGIELNFEDENTGNKVHYKKGNVMDFVKKRNSRDGQVFEIKSFTHGVTTVKNEDFVYVLETDIAFALNNRNTQPVCYHNYVKMSGGVQYTAVTSAVFKFLRDNIGGNVLDSDYGNLINFVVSTRSNYASFRGQTKDSISDSFIYDEVFNVVYERLMLEKSKGNEDIQALLDIVNENIKQRLEAREIANLVKMAATKKVKKNKSPEKFVSCDLYEKSTSRTLVKADANGNTAELWICEGDSAKGSIKDARNKVFQAIYPIRGKGVNVAKVGVKKALQNKEIKEIFTLIGTGFDLNIPDVETFDMDKLRFDKIIFATDADEDGYQIRVLLFLTFYKLAPRLITEGHVFIAETPRFRIDFSDGTYAYAKDDAERDKIKSSGKSIKKISRFKGLGEVDASVLRETTVHPDTRNLIPVTCDLLNTEECGMIDALFGLDKFKQRKNILKAVLNCDVTDLLSDTGLSLDGDSEEDEEVEE